MSRKGLAVDVDKSFQSIIQLRLVQDEEPQNWNKSMNVFDLRTKIIRDYGAYARSFIKIKDPSISEMVGSVT